jgi:hypothetical protein
MASTIGYVFHSNALKEIFMASSEKQTVPPRWLQAIWKLACRLLPSKPSVARIANILGATLLAYTFFLAAMGQWLSAVLFMTPMAGHPWSIIRLCYMVVRSLGLIFLCWYWSAFGVCVAAVASYLTGTRTARRIPWLGISGFVLTTLFLVCLSYWAKWG